MLNFKYLSMMDLRSKPGETLDRVANGEEAFIIERNGKQMACLVPVSTFFPNIQPTRLNREFELLKDAGEEHATTITDEREIELHFWDQGAHHDIEITILLPHGYPNAAPKIFAEQLAEDCPHRWPDGSLCVFGHIETWNPGKHDVTHCLYLARRWLTHYAKWTRDGVWGSETHE
jgi:antitoxin (DNA-binding transcriptional repressor) of toxin-antitoxin stability system